MTEPEYTHKDSRRFFAQILTKPVKQVNYYEAKNGSLLGNHYHKKTTEYFILLTGHAVINIDGNEHLMKPLCVEVVRPNQIHSIRCLSKVKFMTFLSYINGHKNLDIHKVPDKEEEVVKRKRSNTKL